MGLLREPFALPAHRGCGGPLTAAPAKEQSYISCTCQLWMFIDPLLCPAPQVESWQEGPTVEIQFKQ